MRDLAAIIRRIKSDLPVTEEELDYVKFWIRHQHRADWVGMALMAILALILFTAIILQC